MASLSARSQIPACAVTPCARISFIVVWSAAWPRAQIETAAPAPANASAIDRPIPRLPPVTTARLTLKPSCIKASPQAAGDIASPVPIARRPAQVLLSLVLQSGDRQRLEQDFMPRRRGKDELSAAQPNAGSSPARQRADPAQDQLLADWRSCAPSPKPGRRGS